MTTFSRKQPVAAVKHETLSHQTLPATPAPRPNTQAEAVEHNTRATWYALHNYEAHHNPPLLVRAYNYVCGVLRSVVRRKG